MKTLPVDAVGTGGQATFVGTGHVAFHGGVEHEEVAGVAEDAARVDVIRLNAASCVAAPLLDARRLPADGGHDDGPAVEEPAIISLVSHDVVVAVGVIVKQGGAIQRPVQSIGRDTQVYAAGQFACRVR